MTGGLGGVSTPVPFPNTAVKGPRGDGTAPRSAGEQRAAGLLFESSGPHGPEDFFLFLSGARSAHLHAWNGGILSDIVLYYLICLQ